MTSTRPVLGLCLAVLLPLSLAQLQLFTPTRCRLYGGRCQRDIDCGGDRLMRSNFGPGLCRTYSFNGYCCSASRDLCLAYGGRCQDQCRAGQVAETGYHALCRRPTLSCCFPNRQAVFQNATTTTTASTASISTTNAFATTTSTSIASTTTASITSASTSTTSATPTVTSAAGTTTPGLEDVPPQPAPDTTVRDCGQRSMTRLWGGFLPAQGEWPWMAAVHLGHPDLNTSDVTCAAVLVSPDSLLTYSACVADNPADAYYVTLGDLDASTSGTEQVMQVAEVIRTDNSTFDSAFAPGFSRGLALVRVNGSVEVRGQASPVCLPSPQPQLRPHTRCFTAGYGNGDGSGAGRLRAASVRLLSREFCQGTLDVLTSDPVADDVICSAAPRYDNVRADCPLGGGDLGGMLVCEDTRGLWTLVGVTAPKVHCQDERMPNLYLNVSAYSQWIQANLS